MCNEYAWFVQICAKLLCFDCSSSDCVADQSSNPCPTILIVEDDRDTLEEVKEALSEDGFLTLSARNVQAFETIKKRHVISLFLIDLNLPDGNGLTLVREIRSESEAGIIIISGKTDEIDRVVGLEIGADDYISKPFSPRELLARVRSVLRRTRENTYPATTSDSGEKVAEFLDWKLDLGSHHLLAKDGRVVELTSAEFDLLSVFVESPHRVLSRDFLLDQLHGHDWDGYDRGVDGLVSRLRRKTQQPAEAAPLINSVPLIKTVRGAGYMFTARVRKGRS
ncbi:MAG: DNA-binding response OmpR family regulator [Candidatus Azotimanducaceae bacterium]|jgi:DNA-binding response OmpR family regulator